MNTRLLSAAIDVAQAEYFCDSILRQAVRELEREEREEKAKHYEWLRKNVWQVQPTL